MTETVEIFQDSGPERIYHDALKGGRFLIQRCNACTKHVFYPRVLCSHCGSPELCWVEPSGRGTVYSRTTLSRKPEAGGDLNVSLVDLEEGVRMMSRVDGIAPTDVRIGMPVHARIVDVDAAPLVIFVPMGGRQ